MVPVLLEANNVDSTVGTMPESAALPEIPLDPPATPTYLEGMDENLSIQPASTSTACTFVKRWGRQVVLLTVAVAVYVSLPVPVWYSITWIESHTDCYEQSYWVWKTYRVAFCPISLMCQSIPGVASTYQYQEIMLNRYLGTPAPFGLCTPSVFNHLSAD